MFWKKKSEEPKKLRAVRKNELTVRTRDGATLSWAVDDWNGTVRIEPWKQFYKWFFGRTGAEFVMRYDVGETMIRRDDIASFTVHVHTKMVDA